MISSHCVATCIMVCCETISYTVITPIKINSYAFYKMGFAQNSNFLLECCHVENCSKVLVSQGSKAV